MLTTFALKRNRRKRDPDRLRGHLDYMDQGIVGGWAGKPSRSGSTKLEVRINGDHVTTIDTAGHREDLVALGFPEQNNCGYTQRVNVYPYLNVTAGKPDRLSVFFQETGKELSKSPLALSRPDLRYHIDRIDGSGIHGWIYDTSYLKLDLAVDFFIDGKKAETVEVEQERPDLVAYGHPKSRCGFHFDYRPFVDPAQFAIVTGFISGTSISVFRKPLVIEPLGAKLQALGDLARLVRQMAEDSGDPRHEWLLLDLLPSLMKDVRETGGASLPAAYSGRSLYSGREATDKVDVIIPVYEGLEETLGCIDSVLQAKNRQESRLIVINDKSPNAALTAELRNHARRHGYLLLENAQNLGFVGTVNRGMSLHEDADVVLLNADTVVPDGWLDQMVAQAYSDPTIATVTPFSNNATICSYPNFCADNRLPQGADVNALNRLFRQANAGKTIDLPTAHGFCMLIKRAALKELGLFDDQKWGKGYGEENDFSLRAEQHGWRNVMALDTFVQHLGSVSFAADAREFMARNQELLDGLYPDYGEKIAEFIRRDPVRPYRNAVALEQLKQEVASACPQPPATGKTMLFVSLTFGGGTKVATDDLARLLRKDGQCVLMLTSPEKGRWRLSSHLIDAQLDYAWPAERDRLVEDLKALDVWHIHYHHTIEFPKEVWELPAELGVEYDVTIHDYFTICPRVNLIDETRRYCGEPPVAACERCIEINGVHDGIRFGLKEFGGDVASWRGFHQQALDQARQVFTPSRDTAERISRHFPSLQPSVRPHPEEPFRFRPVPLDEGETINVAFIGAIGLHKGFEYLVACARHAEKWALPLHFHVIGYTEDDDALASLTNVTLHGRYKREELAELLQGSGCQVAALLSVAPETYGYVLSEALRNGLRPIAFDLGSIAARIRELPGERLIMDFPQSPEQVNRHILELARSGAKRSNQEVEIKGSPEVHLSSPLTSFYGFRIDDA